MALSAYRSAFPERWFAGPLKDMDDVRESLHRLQRILDMTQASTSDSTTVEEEDGSPSVDGVNKIKVTNGTLTDNGSGSVSLDLSGSASLTVTEEDNSPSVTSVSEIRVTNGTLTDNGSGSVSLDLSGTGGSITVKEADASPSVSSVTTIVVNNGTLTDDGSGQVTLDMTALSLSDFTRGSASDQEYLSGAGNWNDLTATGYGAPYGQYDPDRPPQGLSGYYGEEFTGDTESLTWRQGNTGTGVYSLTYGYDAAYMTADSGSSTATNSLCRWTTGPSSGTDFTITAKFSGQPIASYGFGGCIFVLQSGTEGSPTNIVQVHLYGNGGWASSQIRLSHQTAYTSGNTSHGTIGSTAGYYIAQPLSYGQNYWLQLRYDATAQQYDGYFSLNGVDWDVVGTSSYSPGADPTTSMGWGTYENGNSGGPNSSRARCHYWRLRTDANRDDASN